MTEKIGNKKEKQVPPATAGDVTLGCVFGITKTDHDAHERHSPYQTPQRHEDGKYVRCNGDSTICFHGRDGGDEIDRRERDSRPVVALIQSQSCETEAW